MRGTLRCLGVIGRGRSPEASERECGGLTLDVGAEHGEAGIQVSYTPGVNPIQDVTLEPGTYGEALDGRHGDGGSGVRLREHRHRAAWTMKR